MSEPIKVTADSGPVLPPVTSSVHAASMTATAAALQRRFSPNRTAPVVENTVTAVAPRASLWDEELAGPNDAALIGTPPVREDAAPKTPQGRRVTTFGALKEGKAAKPAPKPFKPVAVVRESDDSPSRTAASGANVAASILKGFGKRG